MTHLYALTSNDLSLCPYHELDPSMSSPTQNDLLYLYPALHIALRIEFLAKIWEKWFLAISADFQPNTEVPTK